MLQSTVTSKDQTTIPNQVRKALNIPSGDRLEYVLQGDRAIIRVHPGILSLKGALASDRGQGMDFDRIRRAAAAARRRGAAR